MESTLYGVCTEKNKLGKHELYARLAELNQYTGDKGKQKINHCSDHPVKM